MTSTQKQRWAAKADQLEAWAETAERRSAALVASRPSHARDIAFLTQPARSSAKVARDRQRLNERDERAHALTVKAAAHREKASNLRRLASTNAGDAAALAQARREVVSATIVPGMMVSSVYGLRRVLKVNAKTLRLEGALAPITIDKALCRVVGGEAAQ